MGRLQISGNLAVSDSINNPVITSTKKANSVTPLNFNLKGLTASDSLSEADVLNLISIIVDSDDMDLNLKLRLIKILMDLLKKEAGQIEPPAPMPTPTNPIYIKPINPAPVPMPTPANPIYIKPINPAPVPMPTPANPIYIKPINPAPVPMPTPTNPIYIKPIIPTPVPITDIPEIDTNGIIESFGQGKTGDCYLLASLMALSSNKVGAKILKNNITKNSDGSVTVELPGAISADKDLKKDGKISHITGIYTITKEEFFAARQSGKYSRGDDDVLLYELAFKKYREEVMATNEANGIDKEYSAGSYVGGGNHNDPLKGGMTVDAMFVLTGNMGKEYAIGDNKGMISELPKANSAHISSIDLEYDRVSQSRVERYLKRFERDPERYALTTHFRSAEGTHAYHLKSVSGDKVVLINPWDSDKEIVMSKSEFLNTARAVTVWDTKDDTLAQRISDKFGDWFA